MAERKFCLPCCSTATHLALHVAIHKASDKVSSGLVLSREKTFFFHIVEPYCKQGRNRSLTTSALIGLSVERREEERKRRHADEDSLMEGRK